jgi:hypothetical protein
VKAGPQIETWQGRSAAAFTPAVILFIALPEEKDNLDPGGIPLALLPRRCPVCQNDTIIGHGRRFRHCHDGQHDCLWVRRGICQPCGKTFTILPEWLAPSAHYTLYCRQEACERIAAGESIEQAAPHCKDPKRLPDSSTVRRWAQRRLISLCSWIKAGVKDQHFLWTPTILAWDLGAFRRILPLEAKSP